jgi:thiamine kinase-like enzyme
MAELFREWLPEALAEPFTVEGCQVELGHYGRQHRCVLRYEIEGRRPDSAEPESRVIYGKVAVDGRGLIAGKAITALRQQTGNGHTRQSFRFNIPQFLGYRRDLQLALLESIPGAPQIGGLLKARLNGGTAGNGEALTLEEALDASARILATLHTSGIRVGPERKLENELAGLRREVAAMHRISPGLGAHCQEWLARVELAAAKSDPLPLCLSHGDFTHSQLLFDGTTSGLVDFDTVCQAEPALDLGHFLAYLRLAVLKAQKAAGLPADALAGQLSSHFIETYVAAIGDKGDKRIDQAQLLTRLPLYEVISLLRIALHSWQKLKGGRLDQVMALLAEY